MVQVSLLLFIHMVMWWVNWQQGQSRLNLAAVQQRFHGCHACCFAECARWVLKGIVQMCYV
jgi:hypothetical protein